REAAEIEQLLDATPAISRLSETEDVERIGELRSDLPPRVERRVRVLEDHLESRELARTSAPRQGRHLASLEHHGSRGCRHQSDSRQCEAQLPAARLTHEPDDVAAL